MELGIDLDDLAADGDDPRPEVEILGPQLGQLAPPHATLDGRLDQQPRDNVGEVMVEGVELLGMTIRKGICGTVGIFTPCPYTYRLHWFTHDVPTGFARHVARRDLATVHTSYARATPDQLGWAFPCPFAAGLALHDGGGWCFEMQFHPPARRTEYFNITADTDWWTGFFESTDGRIDNHTIDVWSDVPAGY
jgi:hypothetical protein